jgi:hypothetical protein
MGESKLQSQTSLDTAVSERLGRQVVTSSPLPMEVYCTCMQPTHQPSRQTKKDVLVIQPSSLCSMVCLSVSATVTPETLRIHPCASSRHTESLVVVLLSSSPLDLSLVCPVPPLIPCLDIFAVWWYCDSFISSCPCSHTGLVSWSGVVVIVMWWQPLPLRGVMYRVWTV